jgi:hypothetical protein
VSQAPCAIFSFCLSIGVALLGSSCVSSDPWDGYPESLYLTMREPSPETANAHLELLIELTARAESRGQKPPPGLCAEAALYLARAGRSGEARQMLAREQSAYPESATFVGVLTKLIEGDPASKAATEGETRG